VLRARLISAAIMVPLVIYGVLALPMDIFALLLGLVLVAGVWEWGHLVPLANSTLRLFYCATVAALMWLLWESGLHISIGWLLSLAVLWWLFALYWLTHPQLCAQTTGVVCAGFKVAAGMLVIVPAWAALVVLQGSGPDGPLLTLGLMIMVWLADSGAYFAGRRWGRNKLAPVISPGKTREGVYGGLLVSMLFAGVAAAIYSHSLRWTLACLLASVVAMLFSIAGDLLESLMKRQSGIKDSGHIIPGHGGILDRLDSLMAAAPLFLAGFRWLEL
jgi:phosphatidate cytidylyltransferase